MERVALSFGPSIAVVLLIGPGLDFTLWGIRLDPILISLAVFVIATSGVAAYRREKAKLTILGEDRDEAKVELGHEGTWEQAIGFVPERTGGEKAEFLPCTPVTSVCRGHSGLCR